MNIFINTIGIILAVNGTILTLWTTFITKCKEAGTYNEMCGRHDVFPKEKRRVIIGCFLIVFGGLLQIISQFIG